MLHFSVQDTLLLLVVIVSLLLLLLFKSVYAKNYSFWNMLQKLDAGVQNPLLSCYLNKLPQKSERADCSDNGLGCISVETKFTKWTITGLMFLYWSFWQFLQQSSATAIIFSIRAVFLTTYARLPFFKIFLLVHACKNVFLSWV